MSCVKYGGVQNEVVDVADIFSTKCFSYWLNTRPNEIKHPQQSFQRALYAHIRGADGRKPFPEEVEKALLRELRQESNPWTRMFGENVFKLGKKGFKRCGYHEAKFRQQNLRQPPKEVDPTPFFAMSASPPTMTMMPTLGSAEKLKHSQLDVLAAMNQVPLGYSPMLTDMQVLCAMNQLPTTTFPNLLTPTMLPLFNPFAQALPSNQTDLVASSPLSTLASLAQLLQPTA